MIDIYYWPTPNGHKITMMCEEAGLAYTIHPVDITKGEQMAPAFIALSPNNRMPAIVDHEPADDGDHAGGGEPLSVFESGAILLYLADKAKNLADKAKNFAGATLRERVAVREWLFWSIGGLGPMAGQMAHFTRFAPEQVPYGIKRYTEETRRLLGVLDRRLANHPFVAGDNYSVADMASYPWALVWEKFGPEPAMAGLGNVQRWIDAIRARPATVAAYANADTVAKPSGDAPVPPS